MPNLTEDDLRQLRQRFPALSQQVNERPLIYLDNAATTQKPDCVLDALVHWYRDTNANVHRASHALSARATAAFEEARHQVRTFLHASDVNEVIWTRGTTEAINLVAQSWGRSQLKPGDEIIVTELDHHANIVPWQMLAQDIGVQLRWIPVTPGGELDLAVYRQLLGPRTRLVAVGHVSNALGTINPVTEICALAREAGALSLVDGAQAVGHFPVDVQAIGCDFYTFSGHKAFGPTGIGVLWGRKALLESLPPWQGGGEMIAEVSRDGFRPAGLPFRFEAGTPNMAGAIGLARALAFLQGQDRQALEAHEQQLLVEASRQLAAIPGVRLVGSAADKVSVVSFVFEGSHHQDLGMLLDLEGIAVRVGHHCAMPLMQALGLPGTVRASFAFYNTREEVSAFTQAVARTQEYLG